MSASRLREQALALDASDPLARFRERFVIADPGLVYLDGNSLGRLPRVTAELAATVVERQWGERLVRSWNEGWLEAPARVGAKIARLIGAAADEVIVADSTSVNLFKLVVAALLHRAGRHRILSDNLQFPSDLYILQGIVSLLGGRHRLEIVPSPDGIHGPVEALTARLDDDVALVVLSHTAYKSGYTYDLAALTQAAHAVGALILWDLSHSVGALPIDLAAVGADLAVGCTYKYLNGGPGAPAFLYVRRDLQEVLHNPISGWMGSAAAFDFALDYRPAAGLRRFLTGTPAIVSLSLIEPGVDLLLEAGMETVRAKSVRQTAYFIALWEELLAPLGFRLGSPQAAERRGSHVALGHDEGLAINLALIHDFGIVPDFRPPDTIRFGFAPLYTSFRELYDTAMALVTIVTERRYEP
ncbi:MAG: kynureninase, partial [Caldilineales bacterium]|nr:kynureninase [Caldilineales bacterium]